MDKNEIVSIVYELLSRKFLISEKLLTVNNRPEPLIGDIYKMDAITLTYLFFELQREFGIQIHYSDLISYRFMSIDSITSLINNAVKENHLLTSI
jgi:acyl carrier protein